MKYTGAQILLESLVREGVEVVFGYPGGANLPIYDALRKLPDPPRAWAPRTGRDPHGRWLCPRERQGWCCPGHLRPGATNLVTGIATAMMDSSPIVCITGQVASYYIGYDAFQETDITGITLPITKHNYLVTDVHDIGHAVREAFYIARTGRPGPVLVDIAKDAQQASIEWAYDDSPIQHARLPPRPAPHAGRSAARRRDDRSRQAAGDPGRARRADERRHDAAARVCRKDPDTRSR